MSPTDDDGLPPRDHNLPTPLDRAAALIDTANRWRLERPAIVDDEQAGVADEFVTQLRKSRDELRDEQKEELTPIELAETVVRMKYRDPLAKIDLALTGIIAAQTVYLQKKQERLNEEAAQRRRYAADMKRRANEAITRATITPTVENDLAAKRATEAALAAEELAEKPPERARAKGDLSAKSMSLRAFWHAEVVDEELALKMIWASAPMRAAALVAITKTATQVAGKVKDADAAPPGFRFVRTERAQ